ncbi:helix-turn-helix domain-containing protein [Nocardia rhizosphaerae]|uniref:Helix-turn-helix domain-containing protein n=1 Tax=Nocardia rhizosphaerae TaxID=1691571 RepID=A0ABV8KY99_9NOCA
MRIVAVPAVTVVVQVGEAGLVAEAAGGTEHRGGMVSGLVPGVRQLSSARVDCVEVRMSPLTAYPLLGLAPRELSGTVAGLDEVWGRSGSALRERLADTPGWQGRFTLTTRFLADHATRTTPDPEVAACWQRIVGSGGRVRVGELLELTGWSQKRLWTRFTAQIGETPKRAAMVVRFRHAFDRLIAGEPAAAVATTCGYTDQSHLHRDIVTFAGTTPGALTPPT